jgi:hypothetical protein
LLEQILLEQILLEQILLEQMNLPLWKLINQLSISLFSSLS